MVVFSGNTCNRSLFINKEEKKTLNFIPVCDLFDEKERLYIPNSRVVDIDFTRVVIPDISSRKRN
jgi:hypothetical protein